MADYPPSRPNIVLIHSDQHRYDSLGCNGNSVVKTPHLDRLAGEGVRFTHAFTPIPICSPARASLLTGTWPTQHGVLQIPNCEAFRPARSELPVLTRLLAEQGYVQYWVGKFHNEVTGGPTDYGVASYTSTWNYRAWREAQGIPPLPFKSLLGQVDAECPADKSPLAWQADETITRMREAAATGQPFFMRWDPPEPHLPCQPPEEFAQLYKAEDMPPWPSFPDPQDNKPAAQRRQVKIWGLEGWTWEDFAPIVARYFAIITELDHHVGRIVAELERLGVADNTLIIYSTDHGDYCGGHGQMDKHFAMYDDLLRVPLILHWPGKVTGGTVCDAFVSNELDMAKTILEAAGIPPPPSFVGKDLVGIAAGQDEHPRDSIYAQYFGTESALFSQRMVRDRRYKYVFNPTDLDELYDLETDPGELQNLIDTPAMDGVLARLRLRLCDWMTEAKDPLLNLWTKRHLRGETNPILQRIG